MDKIEDLITLRNMYCKKNMIKRRFKRMCFISRHFMLKKLYRNQTRFNYKMKSY